MIGDLFGEQRQKVLLKPQTTDLLLPIIPQAAAILPLNGYTTKPGYTLICFNRDMVVVTM